jgi:Double zinc ribbon
MKCPRCQQENPPQAKFCLECATPLALRCANCGTQLPARTKFCFECAAPVGAPGSPSRFASPQTYTPKHLAERIINSKAAIEGERKQVTVLFADLKGSMELLADRDSEKARKLLDPVLRRAIARSMRLSDFCCASQVQPLLVVFEDLHWVDGETQRHRTVITETIGAMVRLAGRRSRPSLSRRSRECPSKRPLHVSGVGQSSGVRPSLPRSRCWPSSRCRRLRSSTLH